VRPLYGAMGIDATVDCAARRYRRKHTLAAHGQRLNPIDAAASAGRAVPLASIPTHRDHPRAARCRTRPAGGSQQSCRTSRARGAGLGRRGHRGQYGYRGADGRVAGVPTAHLQHHRPLRGPGRLAPQQPGRPAGGERASGAPDRRRRDLLDFAPTNERPARCC